MLCDVYLHCFHRCASNEGGCSSPRGGGIHLPLGFSWITRVDINRSRWNFGYPSVDKFDTYSENFEKIGDMTFDPGPVSRGHVRRKWRSVVSAQDTRAVSECLRFRNICKGVTTWHWWIPHSPWPLLTLSEVIWGQWPLISQLVFSLSFCSF